MRSLIVLVCVLWVAPVWAQSSTYELRIYVGSTTQVQSASPLIGFTCGQPKATTLPAPVTNPTGVVWDDPADPTRDCVWVDSGTGPLRGPGLPFGNYESTVIRIAGGVASEESAPRVPFRRAPNPVTNQRFVKQ